MLFPEGFFVGVYTCSRIKLAAPNSSTEKRETRTCFHWNWFAFCGERAEHWPDSVMCQSVGAYPGFCLVKIWRCWRWGGADHRPNPHWTRARKFASNSIEDPCIQCEHSHAQQQDPFSSVDWAWAHCVRHWFTVLISQPEISCMVRVWVYRVQFVYGKRVKSPEARGYRSLCMATVSTVHNALTHVHGWM